MPVITWTARPDGTVDYANQTFLKLTGAPTDVLPGDGWLSVVHDDDKQRCLVAWQHAVKTQTPYSVEFRIRYRGGEYHWSQVSAEPIRGADGSVTKWYGTAIDVDATRSAERQARGLADTLAATFESISDILFSVDTAQRFRFVNRAASQLVGREPLELTGLALAEALPPTLVAQLSTAVQRATQLRAPQELELELELESETTKSLHVGRVYPSSDGWVIYLRNETELRRAQEEIEKSEQRFRLLCRATNDAIWDWDLQTDLVWWNDGFFTLFGYQPEEIEPTALSWTSRLHPADSERVVSSVKRAIATGESQWAEEYRFRRADGSYSYVLDRGHVIRDEQGRPLRMIGGMTDLTEHREAQERLSEQAALLEHASDAILVWDLQGRLTYLNRKAETLYGWKPAEALGSDVRQLHFAHDVDGFDDAHRATQRDGQFTTELEQACANGTKLLVESRWSLLLSRTGEPYGVLSINSDIREKKKLEQQLLRTQRLESVGTLAGGIAHDLNNVLTPVSVAVDLLREGEKDPERLGDLENIEACVKRATQMIKQLLVFARGGEGQRENMTLDRIVRDVERMVRDAFPKNISLNLSLAEGLWPIRADATELNQVLMNLFVNARDAMPDGGTLRVATENVVLDEVYAGMNPGARPGPYVVLRVEDSGAGMSPDVVERIFEPFFTTKPLGRGTGLGLSTTHAIIKAHGGFINVYTELKRGTRFHVYLPASAETDQAEVVSTERAGLPRGKGECVLIVDDEEHIRTMVQRTLERFGYSTMTASNGAEALGQLSTHGPRIEVVLTDMAMPIMDGAALIIALKTMNSKTRIIGSSGLDANGRLAIAVGAGVKHFVPKPYTAETLLKTLRQIIDE